jgi:hypothetical protein
MTMTDYTVWINMTAPYKSGKGRRTVWRGKARVDAVDTEHALRSQSFESIGKTYIHNETKAVCVLGAGWEVHVHCPGEKPHCKACGTTVDNPSNFCRDCRARPDSEVTGDEIEELAPRFEKVATNQLRTVGEQSARTRSRPSRRKRKPRQAVLIDELMEQAANLADEF